MNARNYTSQIIDLIDDGALDARTVLNACLSYMSESDIQDMAESEGFIEADEEPEIDFDEYDSSEFDVEAMKADHANGNFSEDDSEDYRVENIVRASLVNGQFTQARAQCTSYGLNYDEELAAFRREEAGE